jgi:hypothetical protein
MEFFLVTQSPLKINFNFQAVSEQPKWNLFREGMRLFFHHFLLKQKSKLDPSLDFDLLQRRVQLAERALSLASSKLRL